MEIINMNDNIKHFFEIEIEQAQNNIEHSTPMFNGVDVGFEKSKELNEAHIRFCKAAIISLSTNIEITK